MIWIWCVLIIFIFYTSITLVKKPLKRDYLELDDPDIEELDSIFFEFSDFGYRLSNREMDFVKKYPHIKRPEIIIKEDFYYYVHNYRCTKLSNLPLIYIMGAFSRSKLEISTTSFTYGMPYNLFNFNIKVNREYVLEIYTNNQLELHVFKGFLDKYIILEDQKTKKNIFWFS